MLRASYAFVLTRAKTGLTMSITCSVVLLAAGASPVFITDALVSFRRYL